MFLTGFEKDNNLKIGNKKLISKINSKLSDEQKKTKKILIGILTSSM